MKYKGIIFDLDGVLCSTDRFHFEAWKQTAEEVGAPFDETINMKLRGVSRMESLETVSYTHLGRGWRHTEADLLRRLQGKAGRDPGAC